MAKRQTPSSVEAGCNSLKAAIFKIFGFCTPFGLLAKDSSTDITSGSETEVGESLESLQDAAARVAKEFEFSGVDIACAVDGFVRQLNEGLQKYGCTIEQLPSFVTEIPTGLEKGTYLVVDLGGTNIRVCSVTLNGDGTHSMVQEKVLIPVDLMTSETPSGLFNFIARRIQVFLRNHFPDSLSPISSDASMGSGNSSGFKLGFTFSHAVTQLDINRGTLIRWSKGFDIAGVVGEDICVLLQTEIKELSLPVQVTALINDTVGTLLARAYASPSSTITVLGAVFGTGSNGAYVEKRSKVTKLPNRAERGSFTAVNELMIINTEWGNFDQKLDFLPGTSYDLAVDSGSVNPGIEMFEKRISGMYLGEILRLAVLALVNNPRVPIFSQSVIPDTSPLRTQWGVDSEFMSLIEADTSNNLTDTRSQVEKWMDIAGSTFEDAKTVKTISHAIGKRSARLSAVALGAVILQTKSMREKGSPVDIGVDGSLIELYPGFIKEIRAALKEIPEIGIEGEKMVTIAIAKDGSGVGAALAAAMAFDAQRKRLK